MWNAATSHPSSRVPLWWLHHPGTPPVELTDKLIRREMDEHLCEPGMHMLHKDITRGERSGFGTSSPEPLQQALFDFRHGIAGRFRRIRRLGHVHVLLAMKDGDTQVSPTTSSWAGGRGGRLRHRGALERGDNCTIREAP